MKVTGQQPHNVSDLTAGKTREKGAQAAPTRASRDAQETAPTSNRAAATLHRIQDALRAEPDIRAERVAELKAKVNSGEYKVDSEKLAGKMIVDSLQEDLERP